MKTRLSRLKKNQMNITINPKYEYLSPFIQSLPTVFETKGTMLHDKRNVVKQFDIEGMAIVVKRYKVPLFFQRIDYTFCRPSKAKRAYLFALRLIELGIQTPAPIAFIECKKGGVFRQGFFVSTFTGHPDVKSNLDRLDNDTHFFNSLIDYFIFIHDKGFLHGDTNLTNFLFYQEDGQYRFEVIDINRSHFKEHPSKTDCLNNLMRITRDRHLSKRIVEAYANRRGWNPDEAVSFVAHQIDKYEQKRRARQFYKDHLKRK